MNFPEFDFNEMNEADVREEIIAPLIREMGYRSGTPNDVIREQILKYPRSFLGRKKDTDPPLRGKADYICETENKTRWVIEAKAPSESIDDADAIEQAWSYANHPEVRSVYFCLCNGSEFRIYQTNKSAEAEPIYKCEYTIMGESLDTIGNILSPDAITRDYPAYEPDYGAPLAKGLRSFANISNGLITYEQNSIGMKPFEGLTMTITSGSIERTEDGKIEAFIKTHVPFQKLQELNEQLGIDEFVMQTDDKTISDDPKNPTVIKGSNTVLLPRGTVALDLNTWQPTQIPIDLTVLTTATAAGHLEGNIFKGDFYTSLTYQEAGLVIELSGTFKVPLS